MTLKSSRKFFQAISVVSGIAAAALLVLGIAPAALGPCVIVFFASLAISSMVHPSLKNYAFTLWVFAFVAASMFYPSALGT